MPSKREFHDQGDYSSRSHLSKAYQARQGTPTQDSTQRKSRDDTLSYADEDQLADHDEEPSTNKGPTHDYDTPLESTHKLIEDFRNPSKQASSKGSQPSNILGALTMARSRSRNPNQTSQREDRSTPSLQASDRRAEWNKENQSSHNYYERSLNLKDVRLSNDSFGMEKPFRTNEYQTEEDNEAYQSTSPARPFFRGPSHKDEASEYDSGSVMPGDCWQRSRASANTRGPARDQSGFYSHMSEAESRSMEWEDDYE